jgi:sigma-B regulation protein RsbU (phosphoserine phosphatase)
MRWRTKRGERFWVASTRRSRIFFALAIFCTFAGLSPLLDIVRATHPPLWALAVYMAGAGLVAVSYAFAALWDYRLIPLAIAFQVALSLLGTWATSPHRWQPLAESAEHQRLVTDAWTCFVFVALGYAFSVRFIHTLARGHAELRTEVTLARRIHDALVPSVSGRSPCASYYGRSQASGAIGGDLVDVVEHPGGTTFYVVDVSGHGVAAGVLMAMLRSAARSALADGATLPHLLRHLNRTICELERPALFATCAVLHLGRAGDFEYALAGHLPILKRSVTGTTVALDVGGPPLGLSATQEYQTETIAASAGDVFLIITDGITEVFQAGEREFGIEGVQRSAFESDGGPADMAERVIAAAAKFGRQLDDQSVLVVKVGAEPRA